MKWNEEEDEEIKQMWEDARISQQKPTPFPISTIHNDFHLDYWKELNVWTMYPEHFFKQSLGGGEIDLFLTEAEACFIKLSDGKHLTKEMFDGEWQNEED